jgi:hypothetical protein
LGTWNLSSVSQPRDRRSDALCPQSARWPIPSTCGHSSCAAVTRSHTPWARRSGIAAHHLPSPSWPDDDRRQPPQRSTLQFSRRHLGRRRHRQPRRATCADPIKPRKTRPSVAGDGATVLPTTCACVP